MIVHFFDSRECESCRLRGLLRNRSGNFRDESLLQRHVRTSERRQTEEDEKIFASVLSLRFRLLRALPWFAFKPAPPFRAWFSRAKFKLLTFTN